MTKKSNRLTWIQAAYTLLGLGLAVAINTRVYLKPGVPYTHDSENHIARFANYKQALHEGQIPPRWAPSLMNHYGYPVFNYNYPLPNILAMPLVLVGLSYQQTFKVLMTVAVALLVVGSWWWLKMLGFANPNRVGAVLAVASSPYLVSAVLYRGSIGEVLALASLPWILGIVEVLPRQRRWLSWSWWWLIAWLTWWLLAHNVTVLLTAPVLVSWTLWRWRSRFDTMLRGLIAGLAAIGLSWWFWFPALLEKSWVVLGQAGLSKLTGTQAVTLNELLWSKLQFGFSFPGPVDSLSAQLGIVMWVTLGVWLLIGLVEVTTVMTSHRQERPLPRQVRLVVGAAGLGLLAALVQLPYFSWVWSSIPFLNFVQFPWRLSLIWVLMSLVWVAASLKLGRSAQLAVWGLVLMQLVVAWRLQPVDFRNYDDAYYEAFAQSTTTANENLPVGFTYQNIADWQPSPQIANGQGEITVQLWQGTHHIYQVQATTELQVIEPVMWFPGWQTTLQSPGQTQLVTYLPAEVTQGRLSFKVPAGEYVVQSRFTQATSARVIGNTVSLVSVLGLGLVMLGWIWQGSRRYGHK